MATLDTCIRTFQKKFQKKISSVYIPHRLFYLSCTPFTTLSHFLPQNSTKPHEALN